MIDPELDLSVASLMRACQGDVSKLPSFMVHDNDVWPGSATVRTDGKGRVHMRRSTFNRCVAGRLPLRVGIWHRIDMQEFHIALEPHHLQGGADTAGGNKRQAARQLILTDAQGRVQGDEGYGEDLAGLSRPSDVARDVFEAKAEGQSRSVRSTVLS